MSTKPANLRTAMPLVTAWIDNLIATENQHKPDKTDVVWRTWCVEKFADALKDSALKAVA